MTYSSNRRTKLGLAALASAAVLTVTAAGSAFSQSPTPPQMPNAAAQSDAASPAGREGANRKGGERHAWNGGEGKHGGADPCEFCRIATAAATLAPPCVFATSIVFARLPSPKPGNDAPVRQAFAISTAPRGPPFFRT